MRAGDGRRESRMDRREEARPAQAGARVDVKKEVAQMLLEAMQAGDTPWQKPWSATAMRPTNLATANGYRGINRCLLGLAGGAIASRTGIADGRWATYRQAAAHGWQVRKGERGTGIVKVVELGADREVQNAEGSRGARGESGEERSDRSRFVLRRYVVFNAQQMDGVPEMEVASGQAFDPMDRAAAVIEALKAKTGLIVVHGGNDACYVPSLDEVRLPHRRSFRDERSYRLCALHEAGHSTLSPKRLDRREALGQKWGDEAYAMEELRAELCSVFCHAELAVGSGASGRSSSDMFSMGDAHIANHAAYLKHWLHAIRADPMAIFTAAKDAELMADYMLGIEREFSAMARHEQWIAEYESVESERKAERDR